MDLRQEQGLFQLLAEAFRVVNRSTSAVLGCAVVWLGAQALLFKLQLTPSVASILGQLILSIFLSFFTLVVIRILAAKAENNGETVSESLSAAVFPTIYLFIFSILVGILTAVFSLLCAPIIIKFGVILFALVDILLIYFLIRLCFAPHAIALRNQGPISVFSYSWNLTRNHFWKVFFGLFLTAVIPSLFFLLVGGGLFVVIPLYFADNFNLLSLSLPWILLFIMLGVLGLYLFFVVGTFFIMLFLNLDYGENRASFTPEVAKKALEERNAFQPTNPQDSAPEQVELLNAEDLANITITKSSVSTEAEHLEMESHLEQVYQPKADDLPQYVQEEDRMPTIFFDEDMAKELEVKRKLLEEAQQKDDGPDTESAASIKMSK